MSFDRQTLEAAIARHGRVARVVVAAIRGSAPREVGAAMLVWPDGQSGTIGGGALEWECAASARRALAEGADRVDRLALGPQLDQCCGGVVTVLTEVWDAGRLAGVRGPLARPLPGEDAGGMPPAVARRLENARSGAVALRPDLLRGWLIEPLSEPRTPLWIWGAGHVGRAIAQVMAPLPEWRITLADVSDARLPQPLPEGVRPLVSPELAAEVEQAPRAAWHLVLTYSHPLDLALCHALLGHGFGFFGLIGSAAKQARFARRLQALGHDATAIARITCPIGRKSFGKHPQAIAIGVAADLMSRKRPAEDTGTTGQNAFGGKAFAGRETTGDASA